MFGYQLVIWNVPDSSLRFFGRGAVMFYADALGSLGKKYGPIVAVKELKLNLVHLTAVPPWITTMRETLAEIEKCKKMIWDQPELRLVTNQKELSSSVADKKVGVILGMQNAPDDILNDGTVSILKKSGIRVIAPCHDRQNILGSGWLNTDIGLTGEAFLLIRECAIKGIIIDISHSGHKTARDILFYKKEEEKYVSMSPLYLMASHGGCYSQYHHIRNLPDDVLKAVAELGGIVGISTLTFTNHESDNSIFSFKDHLARALNLCGVDSVCVGSDASYILHDIEQARKEFGIMLKKRDPNGTQGARFPENPIAVMGPDMLEKLCKFCLPYFPVGISEKVFGQNLLNFFERALPAG